MQNAEFGLRKVVEAVKEVINVTDIRQSIVLFQYLNDLNI